MSWRVYRVPLGNVLPRGWRNSWPAIEADAGPSVVRVVPLTTTIRQFHSETVIAPDATNGLGGVCAAQCQHIRAVSPRRILGVRGNVGAAALAQLRETIALILDLP